MTRPVARLHDRTIGVCAIHGPIGGKIITAATVGNGDVTTQFPRGTARLNDIVKADCGHTGKIITGSPNVYANNRNVARINDKFSGVYTGHIITGSPDTNAEPQG